MSQPARLLAALEQRAKKRFGQHFLASPGVVKKIIAHAQLEPGDRVLEIGPGLGVLTEALLGAGAAVTAVELDRDLAAFVRERLPMVRLIEGDGASIDLPALLEGGGWHCVANLPYNAGTRMITRMLALPGTFDHLLVMVQKEVADRLVAKCGDRNRGSLSVFTEARAEVAIRIKVPPGAFHPPPKVHSAVVQMRLYDAPLTGPATIAAFDATVRAAFVQPRKTIRNNLCSRFDKARVADALAAAGVDESARPAVVDREAFGRIAQLLDTAISGANPG